MDNISPQYTTTKIMQQMRESFVAGDPKSLQLTNVLVQPFLRVVLQDLSKIRWQPVHVFDRHVFGKAALPPVLKEWFAAAATKKFFSEIMGRQIKRIDAEVYCFHPGAYTLMQDEVPIKKGVTFELDFTPGWDVAAGGFTSFVDGEEKLRVLPGMNQLTLVQEEGFMQHFVKYVKQSVAKNPRV